MSTSPVALSNPCCGLRAVASPHWLAPAVGVFAIAAKLAIAGGTDRVSPPVVVAMHHPDGLAEVGVASVSRWGSDGTLNGDCVESVFGAGFPDGDDFRSNTTLQRTRRTRRCFESTSVAARR